MFLGSGSHFRPLLVCEDQEPILCLQDLMKHVSEALELERLLQHRAIHDVVAGLSGDQLFRLVA